MKIRFTLYISNVLFCFMKQIIRMLGRRGWSLADRELSKVWKIRLPTSGLDLAPAGTHCMVARILVSSILDVSEQHTFFPMLFMQHWVDVSCLLGNRLCHLVLIPLHIKHVAWIAKSRRSETSVFASRSPGALRALQESTRLQTENTTPGKAIFFLRGYLPARFTVHNLNLSVRCVCEYFFTSLYARSWQYRDRRKPEAGTLPYYYFEWLEGFFIVHSIIGSTIHPIPLNSLEQCICTAPMTNIRPDRDSNLVPPGHKPQSIRAGQSYR